MAVGDCQRAFAAAAAEDGIELSKQSFPWLCERGHLAVPEADAELLERIYVALGGDLDVLATARTNPLRGDFLHEATGTLIEVDESQHFTSFRSAALDLYPDDVVVGFDIDHYTLLCKTFGPKSDTYRRNKAARGFGIGGRQRQRAYYDALRDLATPVMGHPPLIRNDAPLGDAPAGRAAYLTHRRQLELLRT